MTVDDCNDLVFILLGDNEKLALKWWFEFNHAFGKRPIDMVAENRIDEIYRYLLAMTDVGGS